MNNLPVFIHSLFRSGSTYLFNVFRRSEAEYWCYQEALHELAVLAKSERDILLIDHGKEKQSLLRHPSTDTGYFKELYDTWDSWCDILQEDMVYDEYFQQNDSFRAGIPYWEALKCTSETRRVFQECRTSGRISTIKNGLESFHIFLWRNPWDQWWSYKVAAYFDMTSQIIATSKSAPDCLNALCSSLAIPSEPNLDLAGKFSFYSEHPLTSEKSYLLFYMLWCLALNEGIAHSDTMINIDRLSESEQYKNNVLTTLEKMADIKGINFSDCHIPQAVYDKRDTKFFVTLENQVHSILLQNGWSEDDLSAIQQLRTEYQPAIQKQEEYSEALAHQIEQSSRARELTRRYETDLADRTLFFHQEQDKQFNLRAESEARAEQAESKIEQAESKIRHLLSTNQQHLNQLQAIYSSRSWRITAPMRWCIFQLRLLKSHGLKKRLKSLFRKIKPKTESIKSSESQELPESQMTPHARRIYRDLKAAIEKNKENH